MTRSRFQPDAAGTTVSRRRLLQIAAAATLGGGLRGWLPAIADELAANRGQQRRCVLLWMAGGPSQLDTFDMKPNHANGGEFKEIETNTPGLRFSEHLPELAKIADQLAIVRSLSTKEGDHGRGTYVMRTGKKPQGIVAFPTIGSSLSKELGNADAPLPNFVSISPYQVFNPAAFSPGFLGPRYAPATVGSGTDFPSRPAPPNQEGYAELKVDDLRGPREVAEGQGTRRLELWESLQKRFLASRGQGSPVGHDTVYRRAIRMVHSSAVEAFDLTKEPDAIRQAYGRGRFGQGCLMARRLLERGVPFVEVTLGFDANAAGWDTHQDNFAGVRQLSNQLDQGWATLMNELRERGLLESTTFLWMGEFGRTPTINGSAGRDHFPQAWSCVFAGGGIRGGKAYGKTSEDGTTVEEGKVNEGDVLATLCAALGVDPEKQNISSIGRPFKIAEGSPITDILA